MKSEQTKKYGKRAFFFYFLSLLSVLGPSIYYIVVGFLSSSLVIEKVALTATVFMAVVLTLICAINKVMFRSKIWLFVLSLFFVIDNFITMILIFAITQIADELIFSPLYKHYKNKKVINAEIDKRS